LFSKERCDVTDPQDTTDSPATIIVCEDDGFVRRVAERLLESLGYTVHVAESPQQVEEELKDAIPDASLLVTDVVLPGLSGPQLYERLRLRNRGLRVLYMSGYTSTVGAHGVDRDSPEFLAKPFRTADLARKVREALEASPAGH
jgi:DNA-binding NtrC family response regulator